MSVLMLPKLQENSDVKAAAAGKWDEQKEKAFQDVASSLDYKAPGRVKSISSVPTMWARPLSMEMALHNSKYPIREQAIEQWQGMLAALALKEVRRFPIQAEYINLEELQQAENFAKSLWKLLPDGVNILYGKDEYESTKDKKNNPWKDIYVFLWDNKPVGMTSPSTLVVPSEDGKWEGLPWWNQEDNILEAPQKHLGPNEKSLLAGWLENLIKTVQDEKGQPSARNMMIKLLGEFRDSLRTKPELGLTEKPTSFGVEINRGVLKALNRPVKAKTKPSCVRLIASKDKKKATKDLLIIDQDIARLWGESPQNISVYGDQTLVALNLDDLNAESSIKWIYSKDLFLPKFTFIDKDEVLPGAYLPNVQINFNGQRTTPLIPINAILLDYLTPEDLIKKYLKMEVRNTNEGPQVRVTLNLPLSGMNNDENNPQNYSVYKDYPIKEENSLTELPVLEVWPNFRSENWQEYYGFYYDVEFGEDTFQVSFPNAKDPHIFEDDRKGKYQLTRLDEFPSYINCCQDVATNSMGLILLKTPDKVKKSEDWKVGVDFGTSFTNVYVNRKETTEPLKLENLHLQITAAGREFRDFVLFEYFIPETFIPEEKPLPLSTVLTRREKTDAPKGKERPIYDGRIFVPSQDFQPGEDWIEKDLKWNKKNPTPSQLFRGHLALHISALAAKNGAKRIDWNLSYPSAFSKGDKTNYLKNWQDIIDDLKGKTGITHSYPTKQDSNEFKTESLAIAQYFADKEKHNLTQATCIDVGGGTSDISVWENNELRYQCSVQLAGRDLLTQFLEMNPRFLEDKLEFKGSSLAGLQEASFSAKLDVLLRLESENWIKNTKSLVEDAKEVQELLRLMALGFSGLYYYVGTILGVLAAEGIYGKHEITPIYMGGNGSRLLNWLAPGGSFFNSDTEVNLLFSRMMAKASTFEDTKEITTLSEKQKDEVACGLVLGKTKLKGLDKNMDTSVIAGENYVVNGKEYDLTNRLNLEGNIGKGSFKIDELEHLQSFFKEFNQALKELKIDGLRPIQGDEDRLWRDVKRELNKVTLEIEGEADEIRVEPPFILGLKALLKVLGKQWAGK